MKNPPRFFLPQDSIDLAESLITFSRRESIAQITSVLRLRAGDLVDVLDGQGNIYRCRLEPMHFGKRRALESLQAKIESAARASGEPSVWIEIAMPILRTSRYEWALEKLTELGASSIVPLTVEHSLARDGKLERWQTIVREAAEQCERALVPRVLPPMDLENYLQLIPNTGQRYASFICAERSRAQPLPVVLCNRIGEAPHKISVIVGAEGGFTEQEFKIAENAGAVPVSLGRRILRSETAAIYALSLVVSQMDQNALAEGTI